MKENLQLVLMKIYAGNFGYSIYVLDNKTRKYIEIEKMTVGEKEKYIVNEVRINDMLMRYEIYVTKEK